MNDSEVVAVLAALGHAFRLSIWRMLAAYGPLGLPAGTIALRLAVLPSSLSFHLRQMTQAGVLVQRRSSRQIIYAVNLDIVEAVGSVFAVPTGLAVEGSGQADNLIRDGQGQG